MRHSSLTLTAVALASLMSGCFWPMPGQGPDRNAHNPAEDAIGVDTVASLDQIWATTLDGGPAGDPVTSGHGVNVSGARSAYSLARESGQPRWTHAPGAPLSISQLLVHGNDVRVGRWNRTIHANDDNDEDVIVPLDSGTGETVGAPVDGQPIAIRDGLELAWDVDLFGGPTARFWGGSLIVRELDSGATLCCGPVLQAYSASPPPPSPEPLTLGSELIFHAGEGANDPDDPLGSFGNGVRGFSIRDERACPQPAALYLCPVWAVPLDGSTATAPVLGDAESIVYVGTDAGTVYAVDPATATVRWSRAIGPGVTASPALAGGSLFVPTETGALVVLDAATGAHEWSSSADSRISEQPAVAGGVVFTGSANGTVAAFDAAGCGQILCPRLWARATGSAITGAPAVSNGQLYVGTADGRLVAFGL